MYQVYLYISSLPKILQNISDIHYRTFFSKISKKDDIFCHFEFGVTFAPVLHRIERNMILDPGTKVDSLRWPAKNRNSNSAFSAKSIEIALKRDTPRPDARANRGDFIGNLANSIM